MQNEIHERHKIMSLVSNRVAKWTIFVLESVSRWAPLRGQDLKASAAHLYPNFPWVLPLGVSGVRLILDSYTGVANIVLHASRGESLLAEKRKATRYTTAIVFYGTLFLWHHFVS